MKHDMEHLAIRERQLDLALEEIAGGKLPPAMLGLGETPRRKYTGIRGIRAWIGVTAAAACLVVGMGLLLMGNEETPDREASLVAGKRGDDLHIDTHLVQVKEPVPSDIPPGSITPDPRSPVEIGVSSSDELAALQFNDKNPFDHIRFDYAPTDKDFVSLERFAKHLRGVSLAQGGENISDAGLASLAKLDKLYLFDFTHLPTRLAGSAAFARPKGLSAEAFAFMAAMPQLRLLTLDGCLWLTDGDLKHMVRCGKLTSFSARNAILLTDEGLQHLSALPLDNLNLGCDDVGGWDIGDAGLEGISRIKTLRFLDLAMRDGGTEAGLLHLTTLDKLEYLDIMRVGQMTDKVCDALAKIGSLKVLRCDAFTKMVSDEGLRALATSSGLEELDISGRWALVADDQRAWSIAGVSALVTLPRLLYLNLGVSPIDDDVLGLLVESEFRRKFFKELSVWGAKHVTDKGLAVLAKCEGLERLSLTGSGITDEGLEHLSSLHGLRHLDLRFTLKITTEGLSVLDLKNLKRLELWGCDAVKNWTKLELSDGCQVVDPYGKKHVVPVVLR